MGIDLNQQILDKQLYWYKLNLLKPRPTQIYVAEQIAANWDKKFHIVDAPTGVGKAFIAMAASFAAGRSYVLTNTKQLQDQYINGPGDACDLRGKSNYKCGINPSMTAGDAPCVSLPHIIKMCSKKGICPYINQRKRALSSQSIVTNYTYFLLAKSAGPFEEETRDLFVADEAHLLENQLINFAEIILNPDELKETYNIYEMDWVFDDHDSVENYEDTVNKIFKCIIAEMTSIEKMLDHIFEKLGLNKEYVSERDINNIPAKEKAQIKKLKTKSLGLSNIVRKIEVYEDTKENDKWIISAKDGILTVTPLKASSLFFPYCVNNESASNKFLFLSATIGGFGAFIEELGIERNMCNFVTTDTTFDKEDSPIIHISVGKFNYQEIDKTLPKALKVIDQLLNEHKDDKGIIHSTNYKITKYIGEKSIFKKRLLHRNMDRYPVTNNLLLERHENSKQKTVLLSPSMGTGVSLDDELARFQIIIKLPFMSLGDKRVKEKMNISADWYRNKMWQEIMQASGRATRSDDDYCITYILDESMDYFYMLDKNKLPKWFKDRLIF